MIAKKQILAIFRILLPVIIWVGPCFGQPAVSGKPLPPWQQGMLDLHHINTGRGNAAFYIFPDGTTMLFDAGELPFSDSTVSKRVTSPHPNAAKHAYEWIAGYINTFGPNNYKGKLDYAAISHFHSDHYGEWYPNAPLSSDGSFRLTGMA